MQHITVTQEACLNTSSSSLVSSCVRILAPINKHGEQAPPAELDLQAMPGAPCCRPGWGCQPRGEGSCTRIAPHHQLLTMKTLGKTCADTCRRCGGLVQKNTVEERVRKVVVESLVGPVARLPAVVAGAGRTPLLRLRPSCTQTTNQTSSRV